MPDATEYPSDLADALCGWDSPIRKQRIKGRGVGKGITHECYHGFGHAVFYVVAKRQAAQAAASRNALNAPGGSALSFPSTRGAGNATLSKDAKNLSLYESKNGKVSISTTAAIEIAKSTADSSSARTQFRPNSGFEMTQESMCEVYHLCKGAKRTSDQYFQDEEAEYPYSHGIRICLEGVVHSVRLFSTDRHNKKGAINYVNMNMQRCQAEEMGGGKVEVVGDGIEKEPMGGSKTTSHKETKASPRIEDEEEPGTGKESPPQVDKKTAHNINEPRQGSTNTAKVEK